MLYVGTPGSAAAGGGDEGIGFLGGIGLGSGIDVALLDPISSSNLPSFANTVAAFNTLTINGCCQVFDAPYH